MNTPALSRDVVRDLLVLVQAGEASADTRALVERHLAADPELAREAAESARRLELPPTPEPPPSAEKQALDETRRLLKSRTSTFATAMIFTVLPLAFVFKGNQITFLLIRDAPVIGYTWWCTAAVMWIAHLQVRHRLRVSGI